MLRIHPGLLLLAGGLILASPANADDTIFRGKVTLEDGSPAGHLVTIQRICLGKDIPTREGAASGKTGEYFIHLNISEFGEINASLDAYALLPCYLEAYNSGYVSSRIDLTDRNVLRNSRLPDLILTPKSRTTVLQEASLPVPHAASHSWDLAVKQLTVRNWAAAEAPLRAVVEVAPKFAPGWSALGTLCTNLGKPEDARQALQRAIELDPKPLPPYLALAQTQLDLKDYPAAIETAKSLIARDTRHTYVEAHFLSAMALYQMRDFDNALVKINDAIRLDKLHELTRAEYVLGLILEAKGDYPSAGEHLRAYVEKHPRANDLAKVTERIANLGKAPPADLSTEISPLDLRLSAAGEAPVPGGIKAFSAIAQLRGQPSYEDFFLEYCRAITDGGPTGANLTKEAGDSVRAYLAGVATLEPLGEPRENSTLLRISFNGDEQVRKSRAILAGLGWKLVSNGDAYALEPGDKPHDGYRQLALAGLGVDELALRQALQEKREFTFEIPRENARLIGGPAWSVLLKGVPDLPGQPVEVFMKDWRFARVYSGLGAMDPDSAAALVSDIGLANLIVKYSNLMAEYGDAVSLAGGHVAVPGGVKAQPVWAKLAGANPQTPAPFLRTLFDKDQGRLLAFYFDLTRADAAHQQYFTETPERAAAFYKWYRDSAPPSGMQRGPNRWQAKILQKVQLDSAGKVIFPGGREAWATGSESDEEILLHHAHLEALAAIAVLEEKRGAKVSAGAAQLIAQHYDQWRTLFPYFEQLSGLEAPEFRALADFADDSAKAPTARRNLLAGEWNSLVKLIVLSVQAGSLNGAQAAQAFRQACDAMRSPNPSAAAIATLRTMSGGAAELDEALAGQLLRLNGARREAYENVKTLQSVPRFSTLGDSSDATKTLAALSGAVYAAVLDPAYLLVAEDPRLLHKHNFVPGGNLFAPSSLAVSNAPPGSNFDGGFATFQDVAHKLHDRTVGELQPQSGGSAAPSQIETAATEGPAAAPAGDLVFRAGGRIVEVYATVTDSRGRYIDDLKPSQFSILEEGQSKPVFAFEDHTAAVSVALLFDTTGSMVEALPPLKDAAMHLVGELRPIDAVSVYSFTDTVTELQPFTTDKEAVRRAILKTHALGITALYDALVRVNHDLASRPGKKVIIVFTDGTDNASMLTANTAIERGKARGIPIFTIAEGDALADSQLISQLNNMSQSTGGSAFLIRKLSDISGVFEKMSQDLMHGYLVAFQPASGDNHSWRKIEVVLNGTKGLQVRAREGFFIE